jgi:hypothetical protein
MLRLALFASSQQKQARQNHQHQHATERLTTFLPICEWTLVHRVKDLRNSGDEGIQ